MWSAGPGSDTWTVNLSMDDARWVSRLRWWLIKRLARRDAVIVNAVFSFKAGQHAIGTRPGSRLVMVDSHAYYDDADTFPAIGVEIEPRGSAG